jgi:hypothetical protein
MCFEVAIYCTATCPFVNSVHPATHPKYVHSVGYNRKKDITAGPMKKLG